MYRQLDPHVLDNDYEMREAFNCLHSYEKLDFLAGAQIATIGTDSLNGGNQGGFCQGFYNMLVRQHRYLQNEFVHAIVRVLCQYADARHDLRNEAAVKVCQKIKAAVGDMYFDILPLKLEPTMEDRKLHRENPAAFDIPDGFCINEA